MSIVQLLKICTKTAKVKIMVRIQLRRRLMARVRLGYLVLQTAKSEIYGLGESSDAGDLAGRFKTREG